ncbi:tRNA-specific adenosine deaminase 2 [Scaptodrosophila lebanonensis]|uniref:tRNA-specific adenosine deaminase 2 n=1 Tax=Drosophila lebanonensis TaxID=7225 RepID=A0A6J2T7N6_DROLE|nr:tRNA-specific adenosine deaminase 2 [Scaptodrosophila lebanonensis]
MAAFMEEAFVEARRARDAGEVPVGCVFVLGDKVIARGGNQVNVTRNATRHAEFICIDTTLAYCREKRLPARQLFSEISVVVTVEPCIMCSAALHTLGVKEIIYGCENDRFGGKTLVDVAAVVGTRIDIIGGVRAEEAMDLLKEFYKGENPAAPPVAKKKK